MKKLLISEALTNTYTEVEFVCYNSDYPESTDKQKQIEFFNFLKKQKEENDLPIFPYMQDNCDDNHEQFSLAVIILDKSKTKKISNFLILTAEKFGVQFDLFNDLNNSQVDSIMSGTRYDNLII